MKAIINANIYDFESFRENQYILFNDEIIDTGDMKYFEEAEEVFDCKGAIIMPGLINCHTHIYSTFARGLNLSFNPLSFKDILDQLWWKLDKKLDKKDVYFSGAVSACEYIKNGVTTVIDHHASGLDIRGTLNELKKSLCDDSGLRGIFCFETSDRFKVDTCIEENIEFARSCNSENCAGLFGMHASMSLSDKTLTKIFERINNLPIHIHVAESLEDEHDSINRYGKSIVKRLDDYKLIKENSILAHCVYINEDEAEIIGKRGAYAALNPTSNMNNAVGLPNYKLLNKNNIKCLLGNDGLGMSMAREYQNLFFAMKNKLKSPSAFGYDDLKQIINNGYEYSGNAFGIKLGRIKKGYKADMVSINYVPPTELNSENAFSHFLYGILDNFHPRETWCNGKLLMKDYELCKDIKDIYSNARLESKRVWDRINGEVKK